MNISRISAILYGCQEFTDGNLNLWDLASLLEEPYDKIRDLFSNNDVIELGGSLNPEVTTQDVVNTILMFYSMKPYHHFMTTAYGPPTTDYRRKVKRG